MFIRSVVSSSEAAAADPLRMLLSRAMVADKAELEAKLQVECGEQRLFIYFTCGQIMSIHVKSP